MTHNAKLSQAARDYMRKLEESKVFSSASKYAKEQSDVKRDASLRQGPTAKTQDLTVTSLRTLEHDIVLLKTSANESSANAAAMHGACLDLQRLSYLLADQLVFPFTQHLQRPELNTIGTSMTVQQMIASVRETSNLLENVLRYNHSSAARHRTAYNIVEDIAAAVNIEPVPKALLLEIAASETRDISEIVDEVNDIET